MAGAPPPLSVPWWTRMSRWTQTSLREAAWAEQGLLSLSAARLTATNVKVGPKPQEYLHTITNTQLPPPTQPAAVDGGRQRATALTRHGDATQLGGAAAAAGPGAEAASLGGPPVVMMPGYGAGAAFYFRNLADVASRVRLYAVDWLGTGLSGRPRYTAKTQEQAESFFIDSLAAWRQQAGIGRERMILVGHSLGGYLAACYALRHPEHVQHLILVCPAGVPKAPEDWQHKFLGGRSGWRGTLFKAAMSAWEAGFTPHSLVRGLGPWGPGLCERYVANRFLHHGDGLAADEVQWFKQYFYHIIAQQGSGEYALRHLLAPGAFAHEPLVDRLRDLKVPVTFIYGAHDWMRPEHAVELCRDLKKERQPKARSDLHVEIIEDAGHFVFIDQAQHFNAALLDACREYLPAATAAPLQPTSQAADSSSWGTPVPSEATY